MKKARAAIEGPGTEATASATAIAAAIKAVDRAASKGIVHAKMAARTKSRLARAAHKQTKTASA